MFCSMLINYKVPTQHHPLYQRNTLAYLYNWGHVMEINHDDYRFDGPYTDPEQLQPRAGAFVVWCKNNDTWDIVDVGESTDIQQRLLTHEDREHWTKVCNGTLLYTATYLEPDEETKRIRVQEYMKSMKELTLDKKPKKKIRGK